MFISAKDISNFNYTCPSGEDLKLLAYISTLYFNQTFLVLSTHCEKPVLALSYNPVNTVLPYSPIQFPVWKDNCLAPIITDSLVQPFVDAETDLEKRENILKTSIIYIDIHPHLGKDEFYIYTCLKDWGYKGIVIFDDIWYFKTMRDECWYKIPHLSKMDLTDIGHSTGSGLVDFSGTWTTDISHQPSNQWTLVTAYFNLTQCPDASPEIKSRDKSYYFQHSTSTLTLPYPMVIFCDQESLHQIIQLRPPEMPTKYVVLPFDSFQFKGKRIGQTFAEYREKIKSNRITHPYEFDPRNTPSYYLFCMSRYIMLKQVIEKNPFHSTHFAWINFCMERMGISNIRRLPEALSLYRDKFSTCYIDYIPEEFVRKTELYFQRGRCSMCSGFFTGNAEYMYQVCDALEDRFLEYVDQGYGHADETLYPSVYFDHPDWFEHYYGDYTEMITNYRYVYERPESVLTNFVFNSFRFGDTDRCFRACKFLWESYKQKKCVLTQEQLDKLCFYYMISGRV